MFSCILGLGAAFGIMFMLGMEYNQTHHILPFIAIGIGIDDMFVIMECWYNLLEENKGLPLPERVSCIIQVSPESGALKPRNTGNLPSAYIATILLLLFVKTVNMFYKPSCDDQMVVIL